MQSRAFRAPVRVLAWILLLAAGGSAAAQRFPVRVYTERDGLPSSAIHDLVQLDDGRLVVATRAGLTTYDGVDWLPVPSEAPIEFSHVRVDAGGDLWGLSPHDRDLSVRRRENEAWDALPPLPGAWDRDVLDDFAVLGSGAERRIAVTASDGRLALFHAARGWVERPLPWQGHEVAYPLAVRGDELFVGTPEGLFRLDAARRGIEPAPNGIADAVHSLATDRHGRLWYATDRAVGVVGEDSPRYRVDRERLGIGRRDQRLFPLSSGDVWWGDRESLVQLVPGVSPSRLDTNNGLAGGGATATLEDREGLLWVGNERGLSKVVDRRFRTFDRDHGLFGREVTAILRCADGSTVLGHPGGVTLWRGEGLRSIPLPAASDGEADVGRVLAMAEDARGDVWIAADERGLMKIDREGRIVAVSPPEHVVERAGRRSRPGGWAVTETARLPSGEVWIADGGALYPIREGRPEWNRPVAFDEPVLVRDVHVDAAGRIVVASSRGLWVRDPGDARWSRFGHPADPRGDRLHSILERAGGELWLGSDLGVLRAGAVHLEAVPEFAIDRPVYFLERDAREGLWIGTDRGVLHWSAGRVRGFDVGDGLAGQHCNRSAFHADENEIWVGTNGGLTRVFAPRAHREVTMPVLRWTGLRAGDRALADDDSIVLRHDDDDLVADYLAVHLRDERDLLIFSKLEGFDGSWRAHPNGRRPELRYTNLEPGRYRFRVRASLQDETTFNELASPWIEIRAPVWTRAWFRMLGAFFALAIAAMTVSYFLQRRYARRLETAVHEATAKVRVSEARYRGLFEDTEAAMLLIDPDRRVVESANRAAAAMFERPTDELAGAPIDELFELAPGGWQLGRTECRIPLDDGRFREVETLSNPVRLESGDRAFSIVHDVTAQKKMERERERATKLESLGILAGGIAHDFNNLLMVILGNLGLIRRKDEDARPRSAIESAIARARELTQQLLTFSRGGSPVKETASLAEVVRESSDFILAGSSVEISVELPDELHAAEFDPGQINQVLNNLLLNAVQSMPDGGRIEVRAKNVDIPPHPLAGGPYIRIDVRDGGPGMSPDVLERIFDPYFTTKRDGSGLGLATAYSIASRHGGLLTVDSEPGRGSTFHLYLPAAKGDARRASSGPAEKPVATTPTGGRVLVLDDDARVRDVVRNLLEKAGYACDTVGDGETLLERCAEERKQGGGYDLLIVDLTIRGGMGGRVAIETLRAGGDATPAVVMSGYSNDPVMAEPRAHGFDARLSKPFAEDALLDAVHRALASRRRA